MTDLELMAGLLDIRNDLDKLIEKYEQEKPTYTPDPIRTSTGTGSEQPVVYSFT